MPPARVKAMCSLHHGGLDGWTDGFQQQQGHFTEHEHHVHVAAALGGFAARQSAIEHNGHELVRSGHAELVAAVQEPLAHRRGGAACRV